MENFIVNHCHMCVDTHSLNWVHFPLWTLIDSFVWIGIVHGILFDISNGTTIYDEYSTPVWWSRVMLAQHTARICWCCLFSYFISELSRGGLWACPQLSSYSWWRWEYNMYRCWQNYTFNFFGEVDVCELYYWPARVFSRASWRCSS